MGEVPAGEVREDALRTRWVGGVRHPVAPGAARRWHPPGQFPDVRAVEPQRALGRLDDRGEHGPVSLVGDDAQHCPIPVGACLQHGKEVR
jgi:hypothetical protein